MRNRKYPVRILVTVLLVSAVAIAGAGLRASAKPVADSGYWGFDTANLDKTCKPCDDFYQFAMGGWMKANPIPPAYSTWGSLLRAARQEPAESSANSGSGGEAAGCTRAQTNKRSATFMPAAWTQKRSMRRAPNQSTQISRGYRGNEKCR